jgi:uncharacterized delta-60 repeat protein
METHQRGVYVDTGAGDDTVTGSAYGDNIAVGAGVNRVDGGDNNGNYTWGGKAQDVLQINVASQAESDAVAVTQLASGMSGDDAGAFTAGFTHKVVHANGVDYIKGIERINVQIVNGNSASFGRDIPLTVLVQEADITSSNIANYYHLSWTNGTEGADTIDLSSASSLLTTGLKTAMDTYKHGAYVNGGAGNDVITGTAYGDNFVNGAGNARIDGGANGGPGGTRSQDVFEIRVATTEAMAAVTVAVSDDSNYHWMVTYGTGEKDYLKDIEALIVLVDNGNGMRWIPLAMNVNEVSPDAEGLSNYMHFAWANGTEQGDTFNAATDLSAATRALMDTHSRGMFADMGAGNDTVVGTAYGDNISMGAGTNFVDGGANGGTLPWGGKALDVLQITVASQAESDAVAVTELAGGMSGADAGAFTAGYTHKVVHANGVDYIKGIERIHVQIVSGDNYSYGRDIPLAVVVQEASLTATNLADYYHLSWTTGTAGTDTIDLSPAGDLLTAGLKTAMDTYKHGAYVNGGAGNDVITGTAYGDNFVNGAGNARIDGGANSGPGDTRTQDTFEIRVASAEAMAQVSVTASDDSNYQWMVTYGTGEKDYLKNIETVIVSVENGNGMRWIPLALTVHEISADSQNLPGFAHFAWANGTEQGETFNATTDISAATRALMATHSRGIYADMGAGNDNVTGSAYGDNINAGAGTNYVDGGANEGTPPWGGSAQDMLQVYVASQAECDALTVTILAGGMEGVDGAAFAAGFTHKVASASAVNYIKGIEQITVTIVEGNNYTSGRDIFLSMRVRETDLSSANLADQFHLSWTDGTPAADSIDLSAASTLLSPALQTAMSTHKRGVWVDGGDGNDTIVGSAYGDNFHNGAGNSRIDGGDDIGRSGENANDVFEISVTSPEAMAAVTVAPSDDVNYQLMVTYGTGEKDYLKNIESVLVIPTYNGSPRLIQLSPSVNELSASENMANFSTFAWITGTAFGDNINANEIVSAPTRALMDTHQRGVYIDGGSGNDTITGSSYGDDLVGRDGTNYIDGGDDLGVMPWGGAAQDTLQVFAADQAAADAVSVTALGSGLQGVDAQAQLAGFTHKVVNGSEVNYIKGIERLYIQAGNSGKFVPLAVTVHEADLADPAYVNRSNFAFVEGSAFTDTVDLSGNTPLLSAALQAAMATHKRGVNIHGGGGDDIITGTAFGDWIRNGSGSSRVDGGANDSVSGTARDTFEIRVADAAAMGAVAVAASDDPAYQWMVTYGTGEKDYLKNVEAVTIFTADLGQTRTIPLTVHVNEAPRLTSDFINHSHLVTVSGTAWDDSFVAASDISAATRAHMDQLQRGVSVEMGAGNDTIVGSAYGDAFKAGAGTNHIDGGAQLGAPPYAGSALDTLAIYVPSQAAADAMAIVPLTSGMSGADAAAFAAGYAFRVSNGSTEVDYIKNIERLTITVWDDKDQDGMLDFRPPWDPANEVLGSRTLSLLPNSAPSFSLPAGVVVQSAMNGLSPSGGVLLGDGKILTAAALSEAEGNFNIVLALTRTNADGTPDSSFGVDGVARVALPLAGLTRPVVQADGKILVGVAIAGADGGDFAVLRLLADGSVDTAFGVNGLAKLAINGEYDEVRSVMVQPDGKIVLAGLAHVGANRDFAVARLNADGSADTSFNGNGKLVVAIGDGQDQANAAALAPDGKIVLVGRSLVATGNRDMSAIRVNQDGTLDTSFGSGGKMMLAAPATDDYAVAVKVQADGKVLIGGQFSGDAGGTMLVRLGADGALDSSWGDGGKLLADAVMYAGPVNDILVQADGKVLALGLGIGGAVLRRYLPDGTPDNQFGAAGKVMLPGRGSSDQPTSVLLSGDKIVLVSNSNQDDGTVGAQVLMRLNMDGSFDADFGAGLPGSLGGVVRANGVAPQQLDRDATIFDAEMIQLNSFEGATLTLQRQGGANADDVFSFVGGSVVNGVLSIEGAEIASVVQSGGQLQLTFNAYESQYTVGLALRSIAYSNSNTSATPASVALEWSFSDANTGSQGLGGALSATATTTVQIGWTVAEAMRQLDDPSKGIGEETLADRSHFATVSGSARADVFDGSLDLSAAVRTLMTEFQRGMIADMGAGDDSVVGTAYGDVFILGAGTNFADGGTNLGATASSSPALDRVDVFIPNAEAKSSVVLSNLSGGLSGVDADAAAQGYTHKLVMGAEISFLKNIEQLNIQVWNDLDGDGVRDYASDASNEVTSVEIITIGTPSS